MAESGLLERIEREAGLPGLVEALADRLAPADLHSLMMEVYRRRAAARTPAALLAEHGANRFARPSAVSPLALLAWEQAALGQLPAGFEPLALSPVAVLGACSGVARVDQNRIMSTIQPAEVVADSSNVLALEAALRRKALLRADPRSGQAVHLAASHRLLRTQRYNDPRALPHFSALTLVSAGRDQGSREFELATLAAHIAFHARALRAYAGADLKLQVAVTDFECAARPVPLAEEMLARLRTELPGLDCRLDPERSGGREYYPNLCFHLYAAGRDGALIEFADGGAVDWTQKLLNNAKERCVISGIGSERVCAVLPPVAAQAEGKS